MSTRLILDDPERVGVFVAERIARRSPWFKAQAIGVEQNGQLVGGVVFENFTGRSIEIHVAGTGKRWMTRRFIWAVFYYAFKQLGAEFLYGYVDSSNLDAQRLDEHLGFKRVAVLEGAANHGDLIVYQMKAEDCRFLDLYHVPDQS